VCRFLRKKEAVFRYLLASEVNIEESLQDLISEKCDTKLRGGSQDTSCNIR